MGRDVTGLRIDKRPNVNGKTNGVTHGAVHVAPRIAKERVEAKDYEAADHTANGTHVEESQEKQDVLSVKSTNREPEEKSMKVEAVKSSDKKLGSPLKPFSDSAAAAESLGTPVVNSSGNESENHDNGTHTVDDGSNCSSKSNDLHSAMTSKQLQQHSPMMSRKLRIHDEEDNWSMASSTAASVRTLKNKVTVPVAPSFKCYERIERRKEFYTKLEEKHKALEAEKQEYAARMKEEEEAAMKQLRKSMVYRANPVPNFYREGPPPKPELKKLPVTRAKSPNLTRRKSCSDAVIASPEEKKPCEKTRHSIGVYKQGSTSPATPKNRDRVSTRNSNGTPESKDRVSARNSYGTPASRTKEPSKLAKAKKGSPLKDVKETPIKEIKETPIAESNATPVKETEEVLVKVTNETCVEEIKEIPVSDMKETSHIMTEQLSADTAVAQS